MKKKITIIGGGGFIGSHVAQFLILKGHDVKIFDIKKPFFFKNYNKFYIGNMLSSKILEKILGNTEILYNFAALADIDIARYQPVETAKINILGVTKILTLCKKHKIKRFVQASSIYANSQEGGFYGISKRSAEDYIEEFSKLFNLKYTILRFGSLYGERADKNNGIKKLINEAKNNKRLIYRGSRSASRRYIHVMDAAQLCCEILKKKYTNKRLTITGKKTVKIKNLINFFAKNFDIKKNKIKFRNEKETGHYASKPTPIKIKDSVKLFLGKERNFEQSLKLLMKDK